MNWNDCQKECERIAKEAIKKSMNADGWLDDIEATELLPLLVQDSKMVAIYGYSWESLFTKAQEELEILIEAYFDRRVSKESFAEILEGYAL